MLGRFLVICSVFLFCYCQSTNDISVARDRKKPHYHHHHDPYWLYGGGLLYYLAFLLIKFKIIFVLGVILVVALFSGKLFALIKYSEYAKHSDHHYRPEKIYIESPHSHHDHHGGPPVYYSGGGGYDSLPPSGDIEYGPSRNDHYKTIRIGGRNFDDNNDWKQYFWMFFKMIKTLNTSEMAFKSMNLVTDDCRKRFVCKADILAKSNSLLSYGIELLRDESYDKYQTNITTIKSITECDNLYSNCR